MPDAIITSTASTFGTISGTFAADQSTVTGTVTGIVAGTLSGSVGVPGPAGPGVPAGGTAGQYLQKIDGVDYNTDWVTLNLSGYAPLNSPAFTGNPTAPTAALGDNDTSLATTAFVQQELLSGTANAKNLEVYVRNQTGSTLAAGAIVYINGATGNRPTVTLAQANNDANSAQTMGFVKTAIANNGFGFVIVRGEVEGLDTQAVSEGTQLYLSPTVAGAYTTTKPSAPQHLVYVGIVIRSHPNQGVILVAVQNGYELNELHDVSITSPTNGQVLKYNSTTGLWVNGTDASGVAWGGITGTLSSQVDLQGALNLKLDAVSPSAAGDLTITGGSTMLTASSALFKYTHSTNIEFMELTRDSFTLFADTADKSVEITNAGIRLYDPAVSPAATITFPDNSIQTTAFPGFTGYATESYVTTALGFYLTSATAASTYLTQANAASTYQTQAGMSSYLTTASAASTYLTQSTAASTYYLQTNPAGYITSSALSPYLTSATAASTYFTIASAASKADLASPVFTGDPQAPTPATSDNDTSIATTAFVKAQGYLTSAPVTSVAGKTGAVTLAVADVSGAAPLASPTFTGTPTLPTGTIAVTQSAGNNTTAVATTAFVQTSNPDASTTTKGHVELATNEEVITGTSTTLVCPLSQVPALLTRPELRSLAHISSTAVSGSGSVSTGSVGFGIREAFLNSLATGRAAFRYGLVGASGVLSSRDDRNKIDFSKKIWLSGKSCLGFSGSPSYLGDANTIVRVSLGGYSSVTTGNMTMKGIGLKKVGGTASNIVLTVHDGTNLTDVTSSKACTDGETIDWLIYSDGTGNVTLYVNGSQIATTAAGPVGQGTTNGASYQEQVEAVSTPGVRGIINSTGGWLYIEG